MQSYAFEFKLGSRKCWAQGHTTRNGDITLALHTAGDLIDVSARLTPAEARAMANALYEAADFAERTLPTGLGESEAA
jgi:hypothetical protein